jgi:hypothetical protein
MYSEVLQYNSRTADTGRANSPLEQSGRGMLGAEENEPAIDALRANGGAATNVDGHEEM